ncbi:hypothetical protein NKI25_18730 [Mesorhizobium sp. M0808]|uniref:hypothetical protein n=1 Tax=Mesorhizobium sp. M0808 TaxID=2957002 RepID=UPI0033372EEA
MRKLLLAVLLLTASPALADEFCDGFEEGYKTIKGDVAFVPFCPFEPFTPYGSTPFREGIKAGIAAALKR